MITYDPSILAPYFVVAKTVVSVGVANVSIVGADPRRVAIVFSYQGSVIVAVDFRPLTAVANGMIMNNNHPFEKLLFSEIGALVGYEWFAIASMAGQTLATYTISYRPPGESVGV